MNPDDRGYLVDLSQLDSSLQQEAAYSYTATAAVQLCEGDVTRLSARTLTLARIFANEHDTDHAAWLERAMTGGRIEPTLLLA